VNRILITGGSGFIGINLVHNLIFEIGNLEIINLDIKSPKNDQFRCYWRDCSILEKDKVFRIFDEFQPNLVIHLAARTDMFGKTLEDYRVNWQGTQNLLEASKACKSVSRVIITSTQYVCQPGYLPKSETDYSPHTLYGQSKVMAEEITRAADLDCVWTIIRPTNIWGPYHPRYPFEFWKVLSKGYYFHPQGRQPVRCYGYVENIVWQIEKILKAPPEQVNRKTFYVGDRPIPLDKWVDGFAIALTGRKARRIPRGFLRSLAFVGDGLGLMGMRFPITSSRFRSMTEDYVVDMEPIFELFGEPPISLEEGIRRTAKWLQQSGYVNKIYI